MLLLTAVAACDKQKLSSKDAESTSQASPVLAEVNGNAITEDQLNFAMQRTFNKRLKGVDEEEIRRKVLKSLVNSRAMALLMGKELSESDKYDLELKVKAYREELLVQRYLTSHVSPEPVSTAMVKAYYEKHPDEFGGGLEKEVEIIKSTGELSSDKRKALLVALAKVDFEADWKAWVEGQSDLELNYKKVRVNPDVLHQPLRSLIMATDKGAVSPVHNDKEVLIVRVLSETQLPAKPLSQVSADIRRKLAPTKLREAVKKASEMALNEVEVKFVEKYSGT